MTTLTNGDKTVKIDFGHTIKTKEVITKDIIYVVELPEVTCDNEKDAKYVQDKVNEFVTRLVNKEILNKE